MSTDSTDAILKESSHAFSDTKQPVLLKVLEKESPELKLVTLSSHATHPNAIKRSAFTANTKKPISALKSEEPKEMESCPTALQDSEPKKEKPSSTSWVAQLSLNTLSLLKFQPP